MGKKLTKHGEKARRKKERRVKLGVCVRCGKVPPAEGRLFCKACQDKQLAQQKSSYQERLALNPDKCVYCHKNARMEGIKSCEQCRDTQIRLANNLKEQVYNAYGGFVCKCCGETEESFLSIDHINDNGSLERGTKYSDGGKGLYGYLKKNNYPPGYQVFCMNCQWGKRLNNGICPHQLNQKDKLNDQKNAN